MAARSIKNLKPSGRYMSGDFSKYNPRKYFGERPIMYRSSYELRFMLICEQNPAVLKWSSEHISIPYTLPERNKKGQIVNTRHTYHTDFTVIVQRPNEDVIKYIVEVKPDNQSPKCKADILRNPVMKKNAAKWLAANKFASERGYRFIVITEKQLKTKIF